MRPANSPPTSPLLTPGRPQTDYDASSPLLTLPTAPEHDTPDLDSSMNDHQWQPSENAPTTAHVDHDHDHGVQHGDDDKDSSAATSHNMLSPDVSTDVEEGGVLLNDMDVDNQTDFNYAMPPHEPLDPFEPLYQSTFVPLDPLQIFVQHSPPIVAVEPPPLEPLANLVAAPQPLDAPPPPPPPEVPDFEDDADPEITGLHPMALSNANPMSLGPENPHVIQFLELWGWQGTADTQLRVHGPVPSYSQIRRLARECPRRVECGELRGNEYDFQGINWKELGITRGFARRRRMATFRNYVNRPNSDSWYNASCDKLLRPVDNHFRYKSMDIRRDVRLLHFQLRNILGVASRSRIFYPSFTSIREHDPTTGRDRAAMRFDSQTDAHISTLTANNDIMIAGGFYGTYRYRHLDSFGGIETHEGRLTNNLSGITNHVQLHSSRYSPTPLAAFASNDFGFRVVDLSTNTITSEMMYDFAMNCSALSPDMRLRVMVGDHQNVLITDAGTGEILQNLEGHRDYGFACDWAPDGWTVATGNQDRSIRIWDARKWRNSKGESNAVSVVRTEMAGARSLRFSPLGSGKRVLVAAEEADYINIIDAQTFNTKQTIDIFGELGGVEFANGGNDLVALSCDLSRGGVIRLERCDAGTEDTHNYAQREYSESSKWWRTSGYDWMQSPEQVVAAPTSQATLTQKRRRAAMLEDWTF
ncbi:YVTN repeat-like/Quino protein amine dehydrogenase [Hypoxylon fragiforme]|uniref:YVTN repeat-like/Quino protein amine dehydrogenase n=1 Tax=Hypoxylon fragiforme TaxID=63214 RepID=UPI0020C6BF11|nr:YVTN repeat-like/Quino protein amine dehydrogenase [Hypoxylon fragiforme]KAI2614631.1 YVTN repeat-like/Quino protein amine dehydrogenase [Hypoxylon fragiforme]